MILGLWVVGSGPTSGIEIKNKIGRKERRKGRRDKGRKEEKRKKRKGKKERPSQTC